MEEIIEYLYMIVLFQRRGNYTEKRPDRRVENYFWKTLLNQICLMEQKNGKLKCWVKHQKRERKRKGEKQFKKERRAESRRKRKEKNSKNRVDTIQQ